MVRLWHNSYISEWLDDDTMTKSINGMIVTTTPNRENINGWIDDENNLNKSVNDEGSSPVLPNQFFHKVERV